MPSPAGFAVERAAALFAVIALGLAGCGDGVGEPIRKDASLDEPTGGNAYCESVEAWDAAAAASEQDVFSYLNNFRSWADRSILDGGMLPGGTRTGGARPAETGTALTVLTMSDELRCSARRHSRDMAEHQDVSFSPAGETPELRMSRAGYPTSAAAELALVPQLDIHVSLFAAEYCEKVMDPRWVAAGVGKFQDYWTVDFAAMRDP